MKIKWNKELQLPKLESPVVIVCGCGTSAEILFNHPLYPELQVVGVNDVAKMNPTWLLTTDGAQKVKKRSLERWELMDRFPKDRHWSLNLGWNLPINRQITPGTRDGSLPNINNKYVLDFSFTSTITACSLMEKSGAKVIGVIGLDMTSGHFYNRESGEHNLSPSIHALEAHLFQMKEIFATRGVIMRNLSPISRFKSLEKQTLDQFIEEWVTPPR